MKKFLAVLILLTVAALCAGCGNSSAPNANTNSTGTTTYNRSDAATSAPSGGGASSNAAPKGTPTSPGIKPPTDK